MREEPAVDVGGVDPLVVAHFLEGHPGDATCRQMMQVRQPLLELEEAHAATFVAAGLEGLGPGVDHHGLADMAGHRPPGSRAQVKC